MIGLQQQDKAFVKLEKRGLLQKHNELTVLGYENPWRNLALLKKFDGNVDQVVVALKRQAAERELEDETALQALEKLGFLAQHQLLVQKGYKHPSKNLKLLITHQGDVLAAEARLAERCKCKDRKNKFEQLELEFKEQNEKLIQAGYTDVRKNLKLLKRKDGDVDQVLKKLSKKIKKQKFGNLQMKKSEDYEQKKKQLRAAITELRDAGLKKKKKSLKLLAMYHGDVKAVLSLFTQQ